MSHSAEDMRVAFQRSGCPKNVFGYLRVSVSRFDFLSLRQIRPERVASKFCSKHRELLSSSELLCIKILKLLRLRSKLLIQFSLVFFVQKSQMLSYLVRSCPDRNTPTMSERYVTSSHLCAVPVKAL